jgi:hypothetical protein
MKKQFYKHKILLDENFHIRSYLPRLNRKFTVKHIAKDLNYQGFSDWQVFQFASKRKMIVITFNVKDFLDFTELSNTTGVIGVSSNLDEEDIDKKLTALFTKSSERSLFGKVIYISGETEV